MKTKSEAARLLGQTRSEAKAKAARENGRRGGRPLTHFMHVVTGAIGEKEDWLWAYQDEELELRGITREEAFAEDLSKTLVPCGAPRKR